MFANFFIKFESLKKIKQYTNVREYPKNDYHTILPNGEKFKSGLENGLF